MMHKILVVEDAVNISSDLKIRLQAEGFITEVIYDGLLAEKVLSRNTYDCVVLDINIPGKNGLEGCRFMRVQKKPGMMELDFNQADLLLEHLIDSIQQIKIVGTELLLGKLFDQIGFNVIKDELFRKIVLARLCYPLSKLKTVDYLRRYEGYETNETAIYR